MHLGQEVHYYMVYVAYFTKLDLQISDYAKKTKFFMANFALAERLPTSATLHLLNPISSDDENYTSIFPLQQITYALDRCQLFGMLLVFFRTLDNSGTRGPT